MNLLLDTCTFIWLTSSPDALPDPVRRELSKQRSRLYLSDVSALEIALKFEKGKIKLPEPPRQWIETQLTMWKLTSLPLERVHIYRSTELPQHHVDPFDRLLIATAIERSLSIVTPDEQIAHYPVATLW